MIVFNLNGSGMRTKITVFFAVWKKKVLTGIVTIETTVSSIPKGKPNIIFYLNDHHHHRHQHLNTIFFYIIYALHAFFDLKRKRVEF